MRISAWGLAAALLLAAGCGSSDEDGPAVSAACTEAFEAWEAVPYSVDGSTDEEANAAAADTLTACEGPDEWLEGLRQNPGALGLTERATITRADLDLVCSSAELPDAPACED